MYSTPKFMTKQVLAEVLAEFQWPAAYELDDSDLPDGIAVRFPKFELFFSEDFSSEMSLSFPAEATGLDDAVEMSEVRIALGGGNTPGLILNDAVGAASLLKAKSQLRNLCKIVLHEFRSSILGELTWIEPYKAALEREQRERKQS